MTNKSSTWEKAREMQAELDRERETRETLQDVVNALIEQNGGALFIPHMHVLAAKRHEITLRHVPTGLWIVAEDYVPPPRRSVKARLAALARVGQA